MCFAKSTLGSSDKQLTNFQLCRRSQRGGWYASCISKPQEWMDSGFEVEGSGFEEGSFVCYNKSDILCTNNSRRLLCSVSKEVQFFWGFDRPPVFAEKSAVWETLRGKNLWIRLDGRGKPRYFSKDCIKGRAKLKWLEKNKLTEESTLTAWLHVMMKIGASNYFHENLISKWASWKNSKGILRNIGLGG